MVFCYQNCFDLLLWEKIVLVIEKNILKFEAESWEFAKCLRSLEQFNQTVKGQNNFWQQNAFLTYSWRFLRSTKLEQLELKLETVLYTILPTISIHPCSFALSVLLPQLVLLFSFFSLQLLDCFSIPTVLVLSCTVLRSRYRHGFCVSYFVSIPYNFLPREKLKQKKLSNFKKGVFFKSSGNHILDQFNCF